MTYRLRVNRKTYDTVRLDIDSAEHSASMPKTDRPKKLADVSEFENSKFASRNKFFVVKRGNMIKPTHHKTVGYR